MGNLLLNFKETISKLILDTFFSPSCLKTTKQKERSFFKKFFFVDLTVVLLFGADVTLVVPTIFVVPTIDGIIVLGLFFYPDKFRVFNKQFLTEFNISFENYCCLELKCKKIFQL